MRYFDATALSLKSWSGRIIFGLVVLAMLYRGLIPVGYMAAPSHVSGKLLVTLCVTGGPAITVAIDVSEPTGSSSSDDSASVECPYAGLTAQFVLPESDAGTALAGLVTHALSFATYHSAPALPALGPPLGSRAPPSNLG